MKKTVFELKKITCFGSKCSEKFRKSLEKVQKFWKLFFYELSKNYEKMNLNFENCEKLVPHFQTKLPCLRDIISSNFDVTNKV